MNKNITPASKHRSTLKNQGRSERLLLVAIMAIGILGLTFSYGSKGNDSPFRSASAADSTSSAGKVQSDRMILHLNQIEVDSEKSKEISRF